MAEEMMEAGIAACVNLVPGLQSVYRWEGGLQCDDECLMLIKTTEDAFGRLSDWLRIRHPYELPELVAVPVTDGLPAYLEWVARQVTPSFPDA